jgi:class 3 adenylate cyclase
MTGNPDKTMIGLFDLASGAGNRNLVPTGLSNSLVMIVDDEPLVIALVEEFLREVGYRRFVSTSDSSTARAMLLRERPDVLLLDINMPRVSGFDVLASMQSEPLLRRIPAIVLTSAEDPGTKMRALELGASDFLRKPVDASELALRLKNTLAARAYEKGIRTVFSRYVSSRITGRIIAELDKDSEAFSVKPERAEIVALFADLRGFSRITQSLAVHTVVELLNQYFAVLTEATDRHEGTIFNMAGDSLFVGFNVPLPQADAALRAVRTAMEILAHFRPIAADWRERYGVETGVGVGICRGEAIIGNVGTAQFMNYTVIGNAVNVAARLMQMAQANETLVSAAFYESVRQNIPAGWAQLRGEYALRGRSEMTTVYSIKL